MNALALDAEYLPARHQDMQVRHIAKKPFRHHSRLRNHMFGAVQDKQDALATQVGNKTRNGILGLDRQTERGSHCTRQELGIAQRAELHKADGAAEFHQQSMRDGECHRCFAHAARPDDGNEALGYQLLTDLAHSLLAAYHARQTPRQLVERIEGCISSRDD